MPGWGQGQWGTSAWGGLDVAATPGSNHPLITLRDPAPGAIDVAENVTISVTFLDLDVNLDTTTTLIEANGATVYTGLGGFQAGFVGRVNVDAGRLTVQFIRLAGWSFESTVTVRAKISDTTSLVVDDTWEFTVRANPVCYTGLNPLSIETAIQQPMTTFLELEPVRQLLLDNTLKIQTGAIANEGNKRARVLYQLAFATELSTLQNPYRLRDETALGVTVCERQNTLVIDEQLVLFKDTVQAAIQSLSTARTFPEEYIRTFVDYLDSTLYTFRVSLVANLILATKSIELQS